jgi:hypothetical protein
MVKGTRKPVWRNLALLRIGGVIIGEEVAREDQERESERGYRVAFHALTPQMSQILRPSW